MKVDHCRVASAVVSPANIGKVRKLLLCRVLGQAARSGLNLKKGCLDETADWSDVPPSLARLAEFVRLADIASVSKGLTGIKDAKAGPYPLVVTAETRAKCDHFDFEGESVLIPMVSSTGHGDASIKRIHYQDGRFAAGSILAVVRPNDPTQFSARFLYEYLSAYKEELLVARMSGTANVSLTVKKIESVPVPVVPLADQHHLHELMLLCDALEAKGRLEVDQHARLLSTLLGTLTDSTTPEELAANWQRVAVYFDLLLDRPEAVDALERTIMQLAVSGLLTSAQAGVDWTLTRFGSVVELLNGYAFKSEWFKDVGTRLVRNINVSHGHLDWSQAARVPASVSDEFTQFELREGDVVLSLDRPVISTGLKLALIRASDLPCMLLQRVARLRPNETVLTRDYMFLWMESDVFVNSIDPGRSNGVPHISTKQVAALSLALPPIAEQARIVARVTELRHLCTTLRQRLAAQQTVQSHLADALVEQALA